MYFVFCCLDCDSVLKYQAANTETTRFSSQQLGSITFSCLYQHWSADQTSNNGLLKAHLSASEQHRDHLCVIRTVFCKGAHEGWTIRPLLQEEHVVGCEWRRRPSGLLYLEVASGIKNWKVPFVHWLIKHCEQMSCVHTQVLITYKTGENVQMVGSDLRWSSRERLRSNKYQWFIKEAR